MTDTQRLNKIISGGQTGVDPAALDAALDAGFPCGGWCPKGRRAEDGRIPKRYPLIELPEPGYLPRTQKNIEASDATLIITFGPPEGGTATTLDYCDTIGRPRLVIDAETTALVTAVDEASGWLHEHQITSLNIAGPRAGKEPRAYIYAYDLVAAILAVQ